jgi:integrase
MRYAMPNPILIGRTYYLRVRVPSDVAKIAQGTMIAIPVGDNTVTSKVGRNPVKVPLGTKDAAEAKRLFPKAHAAVEAHWEALRRGPSQLTHKQCVALAGEVRSVWVDVLDENPGDPAIWRRVQTLDDEAKKPKPHPAAELMLGKAPAATNMAGLESRFGGFADVILRRHCLMVDPATRSLLLPMIADAMDEAVKVNLLKAQGDYSDNGETDKYPEYQPQQASSSLANSPAPVMLTFTAIIDEEDRRRSLGREGKPLPARTVTKFRNAAREFAEYRASEVAKLVTPEEVEGWKLSLLDARKLSNNTINQRLQNISTVMEWGQQHTLGKLFQHQNPVNVVTRPEKRGVRSEDRTLRLDEARAILRAARAEAQPTLRWLPWMMAYSGARVGEVAQLTAKDFFKVEGRWYYELTTKGKKQLKNEHSIRKVPIHPDLITEGLLEFVNGRMSEPKAKLFKRSAQQDLSVWVRSKVGVTRKDAAPNHGWRHLFEDMALDGEMAGSAKMYITGRASGGSDDGYGKSDAMLPALAREMQKIRSYL